MQSKQGKRFPIVSRFFLSCQQTYAVVEADVRKLRHDPWEIIARMIQPAIWLLIFGQAMSKTHAIPTGNVPYLDFIAPGILAQSVLFIAIFYGIDLIWERDMGILNRILVTPTPRVILVIGRGIAAGVRGLSQIFLIYILSFFLGIDVRLEIFPILGLALTVILGGAIFSTLSLIAASVAKKRERFIGIAQVLTMPLFFASNALYPVKSMPGWLEKLSIFNPLTYLVDVLRHLMIVGVPSQYGLGVDFGIELLCLAVLVAIATPLYPRILY